MKHNIGRWLAASTLKESRRGSSTEDLLRYKYEDRQSCSQEHNDLISIKEAVRQNIPPNLPGGLDAPQGRSRKDLRSSQRGQS